ncbi:hypothetical protein ACFVY7_06760 [[Kitasatospora] papulosa]|uniref:hypothetical protein n=1 Tax=[Kitasatospora] papulosa TaxID=1464011 RepID=UPI0035DD131D
MMTNGKIATALVGGYLLGRTKKAKVAIGLGMFLAGKKLSLDPKQLGQLVADSPLLSGLTEQVRTELFDATKSAAGTALTRRVNRFSDSLSEKAQGLGAASADDDDGESGADRLDPVDEDDGSADELERDEPREEKPRSRTATTNARKAAGKAASTAGTAKKRAPATRSGTESSRSNSTRSRGAASKSRNSAGSTASRTGTAKTARPARKSQEEDDRG